MLFFYRVRVAPLTECQSVLLHAARKKDALTGCSAEAIGVRWGGGRHWSQGCHSTGIAACSKTPCGRLVGGSGDGAGTQWTATRRISQPDDKARKRAVPQRWAKQATARDQTPLQPPALLCLQLLHRCLRFSRQDRCIRMDLTTTQRLAMAAAYPPAALQQLR